MIEFGGEVSVSLKAHLEGFVLMEMFSINSININILVMIWFDSFAGCYHECKLEEEYNRITLYFFFFAIAYGSTVISK